MRYEPVTTWELIRYHSARKGTKALMDVLLYLFHANRVTNQGIYVRRRQRGGSAWSLHAVGRSGDLGIPNIPTGTIIAELLVRRAGELGVCEVIFNRRRWTPESGWRHYSGVNPHTTHIHFGNTRAMADSPLTTDALARKFATALTHK